MLNIKSRVYKNLVRSKKMSAEDINDDYQKMIENVLKRANEEVDRLIEERTKILHDTCGVNRFSRCMRCGNEMLVGKTAEDAKKIRTEDGEEVTIFICQNCGKVHKYIDVGGFGFTWYTGYSKEIPFCSAFRDQELPLRDEYFKRIGKK